MSRSYEISSPRPEIGVGDVAYLLNDEGGLVGWGRVTSQLLGQTGQLRSDASPSESLGVNVNAELGISPPIDASEVIAAAIPEPVLRSLDGPTRFVRLEKSQAAALNIRIRAFSYEAPPDPVEEGADAESDSDVDEPAGWLTLEEALAGGTYRLSDLSRTILERAGEIARQRARHRNRLTSSCLLFGIFEAGRADAPGENAAKFALEWTDKTSQGRVGSEFDAFMNEGRQESSAATDAAAEVRLSARAVHAVETARRLAQFVRVEGFARRGVIHGRDLVAALLLEARDEASGAGQRLAAMEVEVHDLINTFYETFLTDPDNTDDDFEKWRGVLIEGREVPEEPAAEAEAGPGTEYLAHLVADAASGEDLLKIMPEVKGFARIIAARAVKTPLAIGLFGDWGAGKSFFISKLKAEVAEITRNVKQRKGEESDFLPHIVQIDFNAWHYVEANLWASLVSHVFDNLNLTDEKETEKADALKHALLLQLDTSIKAQKAADVVAAAEQEKLRAANNDLNEKQEALKTTERELDEKRGQQEAARVELGALLRRGVWPLFRQRLDDDKDAARLLDDAYSKLGLDAAAESLEEARRQAATVLTTAGRAQLIFAKIAGDPDVRRRLLWLLAALVLIPLTVTLVFTYIAGWPNLASVLTWAGEGLALVVSWYGLFKPRVNRILDWVKAALTEVERANQRFDELYQEARASHEETVEEKERAVESARRAVEAGRDAVASARAAAEEARRRQDEAARRAEEATRSILDLDPARMLARFIEERAASTDYRKHLGIVASVHKDFRTLSNLMLKQDKESRTELLASIRKAYKANRLKAPKHLEAELDDYRIDRIVLYIDDLDRCPPKQVVDVLQAIHLLLAFELFVVVVGVDARWVRRSLSRRFAGMLVGEDDDAGLTRTATPHDYIEKIFQVPFWLRPMGRTASEGLLRGLIPDTEWQSDGAGGAHAGGNGAGPGAVVTVKGEPVTVTTASVASPSASGLPPLTEEPSREGPTPPTDRPMTEVGVTKTAGETQTETGAKEADPFVLKPESLRLRREERDAMEKLTKVIGRTPRTLKRFVNVYRIIKAGLRGPDLHDFVGDEASAGQYRAVLVLLSVAHGAPDVAPFFFRALKQWHGQVSVWDRETAGFERFLAEIGAPQNQTLEALEEQGHGAPPDFAALIAELARFEGRYDKHLTVAALCTWMPVVVRYTFQLGHLSDELSPEVA